MILKLSRSTINDPKFLDAMKKLRENCETLPNIAKYRIGSISQAIYLEMLKAQADAKDLLKSFAMKDEKGEILGYPDPTKIKFESTYLENKHDEAFKKMLKLAFRINSQPITLNSIESLQLTTDELVALTPVLSDRSGI